mgnify:CR=1 FL=1
MNRQYTQSPSRCDPLPLDVRESMGVLLRSPITSAVDEYTLIKRGISAKTYVRVARRLALPRGAITLEATLRRRLASKPARLSIDESERLLGITRVFVLASALFSDEAAARAWLHRPARHLPDADPITPVALARFDSGVRWLEDRILRTTHGVC